MEKLLDKTIAISRVGEHQCDYVVVPVGSETGLLCRRAAKLKLDNRCYCHIHTAMVLWKTLERLPIDEEIKIKGKEWYKGKQKI